MAPIRGLTDSVRPAFPLLGVLRKGAPRKENQNKPGADLEYFRFVPKRPEVGEAFVRAYGEKPKSLEVYLPYASVDDNFQAWQEEWVAGGLVHRCDGVTTVIWRGQDGRYVTDPDRQKPCPGSCKPVGRLQLILPKLIFAGHVGYVMLITTSIHDIRSIQASLLEASELRSASELGLRGIEFLLYRQQEEISTPGSNGKRVRRSKSLVKLTPAVEWARLQLEMARAQAMGQLSPGEGVVALPGIGQVDADTGEIVEPGDEEDEHVVDSTAQVVEQPPEPEPPEEPARPRRVGRRGSGRSRHKSTAAQANGPRPPGVIKSNILDLVADKEEKQHNGSTWKDMPATQGQREAVASFLEQALEAKTSAERYVVTEYLLGKASTEEMNMAEAGAILDWLIEKDEQGNLRLKELASHEAKTVYRQAMIEKGQQALL